MNQSYQEVILEGQWLGFDLSVRGRGGEREPTNQALIVVTTVLVKLILSRERVTGEKRPA